MTRSRTIISLFASLVLGTLMAAPALGALSASTNPSSTGSYTVSDASPPTLPADVSAGTYERFYYYNLVETPPSGSATSYDLGRGPVSQAFSGKAVGTYAYQLQTCVYTIEENEFEAEETTVCTDRGSSLSVSVVAPDTTPDFGTGSVSDKSWTQNSAITAFTVPAATGGNAPLSYSASGLPAGVSMSASRWVWGTPTSHGSGTATVTVTDDDGDTDTLTFDWSVAEDLVPDFGTASVSYKSWVQNSAIAAFTVPAATGGDGTLSYTISGLPAGLSMSASREVSGTPTASGVGTATVTVTDADGDTDTLSFGWSVGADRMPSYGDSTMADRTWKQNAAIATLYIPIPTSGNYPLTYSATGLPDGVSVTGTRAISGTPTSHGTGTATVTVTDNDGDTASLDFDWTVEEDLAPSFGDATIADRTWTLRSTITAVDVPAATGGDGTLRYSASGLPSGLYLTFSTRRIQGIPSGSDADSGTATVTVRDADGDTDTLTFDWTVEDPMPSFGTATVADRIWTEGTRIPTLYLPAATGGNALLRYSADGLPDGLSMSILRRVTGTPTTAGTGTATLTVTDSDGDTDTLQFGWTVETPPPPEGPTFPTPVAVKTWKQHSAIAAFTVGAATGGTGTLSYTASGLPNGVDMSAERQVSGTPSASGTGTATVTVTDGNDLTATLQFAWTVEADLVPDFGTASVSAKTWTQDTVITAFTVPSAMGGDTPLSYTARDLPAGVTMSSARRVSGTPAAAGMGTATVTVSDDDGDTDTLSFDWSVAADLVPDFGTAAISRRYWVTGSAMQALTVPAATGGDAPLSYTATGLPNGVSMSSSRSISGTPISAGSGMATVTVTDADGDTDTLSFDWTAYNPLQLPDVSSRSWTQNQSVAAFSVAASGGVAPLTHGVSGLPAGVAASSSGSVSGTPTGTGSGTATVTVSDAIGNTDTESFSWTVAAEPTDEMPSYGSVVVAPKTWTLNLAIAAFTVPSATGGDAPLSYSASGLPPGVAMSAARVIAGTPTATGSGTATISVTDDDGDTDTVAFDWTVTTPVVTPGQLSASPNPSANGNYTVSHSSPPALPTDQSTTYLETIHYYNIEEIVPGGEARYFNLERGPVSLDFTAKPTGTYTYRLQTCVYTLQETGNDVAETDECTNTGSALTVTVDRLPTIPPPPIPDKTWIRNQPIASFTVPAATGGDTPLSYSASGLPPGVAMSAARVIAGTPTATGSGTATISVTDDDGDTDTVAFDWAVTADSMPAFPANPQFPSDTHAWIVGKAITPFTVAAATGGDAPLTYTATDLPAGVTMSAERVISGTPTAAGSDIAEITVTDTDNDSDTISFGWTVSTCEYPPNPLGPYTWIDGVAIEAFTVPASTCGTAPFSYSATGLPVGLSMSSARVVSGTPTAAGSGTATVTVTDNEGDTDTVTFAWTVQTDSVETGTHDNPHILPDPVQVSALDIFSLLRGTGRGDSAASATYFRFTVPGNRAGRWTVAIDGTPDSRSDWDLKGDGGLRSTSSNSDESDQVTLTAEQVYNFRVYPFYTASRSSLSGLTLTLTPPASTDPVFPVNPLPARTWIQGIAVAAFTVDAATGGVAPLTYSAMGLPAGLDMDATTRTVSGTPTAAGSGTATVTATDTNDATGTVTLPWTVETDSEPAFAVETLAARAWSANAAIEAFTVDAATGGNAPLAYSASGLPAGVTMSVERAVAGTPTATGMGTVTVTVTDRNGDTDTVAFDWAVTADSMPAFPANPQFPSDTHAWIVGKAITPFTVDEAKGGDAPLTYTATDLPAGVTMSAERVVSGTPTAAGSDVAEITVTDSNNDTDTLAFAWTVEADTEPMFAQDTLPGRSWSAGAAIASFTVDAATGGNSPLAYTATGLPAGVTMSGTRRISGTPTAAGSGTATVTVTDRDGDTDTLAFDWTVSAGASGTRANPHVLSNPLQVSSLDIFGRLRGSGGGDSATSATYFRFTVPGNRAGQWTVAIDGTPDSDADWDLKGDGGLSSTRFDADESGTVTLAAGQPYNFRVYPYRPHHRPVLSALTLTLTPPPSAGPEFPEDPLGPYTWVNGAAIAPLTVPEAAGGSGAPTYTVTGLPDGISMSSARVLSGTPTTTGTGTATVTATDADSRTGTLTFDWTVEADTEPVFSPTLPAQTWTRDRAIAAFTVDTPTGGNAPLAYTASGLPSGVTMDSSRSVSGTPTSVGTGTATVTVTDADGDTATFTFDWAVVADDLTPSFGSATIASQSWVTGKEITAFAAPAASGGNAPLVHGIAGLPAGVVMLNSMQIQGTPTAAGSGTATVAARDADGDLAKVSFNWTVTANSAPSFGTSTVASQSWTAGQAITALTVPSATGGNGTLSYGAAGLPEGVTLSPTLRLSGTPLATGSGTATVTARDTDGDTATLTFNWTATLPAGTGTVLSVSPNPPTSANYSVSGAYTGTKSYIYFTLFETNPWGEETQYYQASVPFSQSIANRVDGAYTYRLEGCYLKQYQNYPEAYEVCETVGDTLTVTVDGPDPDSVGTQLGYTFQARVNSTNPAQATAIFIDRTSSATGGGVFQDIVLRKSGNAFELVDPGSVTGTAPGSWSTTTAVDLVLNDINLDGFVDVLVRGLGGAITGALDQIVYAPGRSGGSPVILNAVDSSLKNFLSEVSSWTQDPTYFQRHQEPGEVTVTVYRPDCFNAESRRFCSSIPTVVIEVSGARPTNKSSEAREFANQFSLVDGRINPDVTLGSQRARNLSGILQRVFGTEILNGQLESACIESIQYDTYSDLSCSDPNEVGRILFHHGSIIEQAVFNITGASNRLRALTGNEIELAESVGLDGVIDLTMVQVRRNTAYQAISDVGFANRYRWYMHPSHPYTIFVPGSDFRPDFMDFEKQSSLIHELVHVWQFVGPLSYGTAPPEDEEYFYRPFGDQVEDNSLPPKNFQSYGQEQQAEIIKDIFRLQNGRDTYLPENSIADCSEMQVDASVCPTEEQINEMLDELKSIPGLRDFLTFPAEDSSEGEQGDGE